MTIFRNKEDNELYQIYYGRFSMCFCKSYMAHKLYGSPNVIKLGKDKNKALDKFEIVAVRY